MAPMPHAKENAKENTTASKNTLKIQDFHESWLKDIESYKNQVKIQQMLTTHNHGHKREGSTASIVPSTGKRRSPPRENNNIIADYDELNLKRPREETPASIPKRNQHNNHTLTPLSRPPSQTQKSINKSLSRESTASSNAKIIVNPFHASSLLNSNTSTFKAVTNAIALSDLSARLHSNTNSINNNSSVSTLGGVRLASPKPKQPPIKPIGPPKEDVDSVEKLKLILSRPPPNTRLVVEPPPHDDDTYNHVDDDDNNSAIDVDDIGDIDDLNVFDEESDEDAEDYTGCPFVLASDSDINFMSEAVTPPVPNPTSILVPSLFPKVAPYITFSSHLEKGPAVPPTLHKILKWRLSPVMPRLVRRVIFNSGFRLIKKTTDWMAVWEKHMRSPGFKTIRSHQKFNHLPGSFRIGRKDSMWKNLRSNMTKHGKVEFGFMQKTYILPEEIDALKKVWPRASAQATKWIVKPPASARGSGITVINKWSQIPKDKSVIVQKYIEKPLLINENKFDLRIYVLVTSINPLRIYMYKNGLARFAAVKYSSELDSLTDRCMHLTNYSINKFSENYAKNEDINACQGHKWSLPSLWSYLEKRDVDTKKLWATLRNLVIKSLISGEGCLNRMYRQNVNSRYNCFELFGFDVLLDENLVPWLLEINISPSLHSELPLDLHVKGPLIRSVLNTALYQVPPKLSVRQQAEVLNELNMEGPLCYDRHVFTPVLSPEEIKKHNFYTSRLIEFREEYLETILDELTPDDVRCLLISEDELARCDPLERIFPTPDSHKFHAFIENPRYYNRLLDAWETKYLDDRQTGIELLKRLCAEGYHLKVPPAALIEEPKIELTDIDLMYMKPEEIAARRRETSLQTMSDQYKSNEIPNSSPPPPSNNTTTSNNKASTTVNCSAEAADGGDVHTNNSRPIAVGSN